MQINPGVITIEAVLEKSLFLAGGIQEHNFGNLQKLAWSRAARTDRGVHAVAQCCSMKLTIPIGNENQFIDDVNTFLPSDVRLLAVTRTTKNFNAKLYCSHRRYEYLLPTYMLQDVNDIHPIMDIAYEQQGPCRDVKEEDPGYNDPKSTFYLNKESRHQIWNNHLKAFRVSSSTLTTFSRILSTFHGTHNFHNFTSQKEASEANAKRHIISIQIIGEPYLDDKLVEWVRVSLVGQSFLLNQV